MTRTFRAPGRVNLIGEHTDYNDGFVLPVAIDLSCDVKASLREGNELSAVSKQLKPSIRWSLDRLQAARPRGDWSDYVAGVAIQLQQRGVSLPGAELEIDSQVPIGAGLASSAALEVAAAAALCALSETEMSLLDLALLCQRAEREFAGTQCGIMDQYAAAMGKKAHALLIDCRSLEHQEVPLPAGADLVVVNSMVRHEHASGEYNQRRKECERAAELLGKSLRDVSPKEWPEAETKLKDPVRRRARHVITENQRVLEFVEACKLGDIQALGKLLGASHKSLAEDYEVSCPELDALVEIAAGAPGFLGARMTGGGFGGCTVNLVKSGSVAEFRDRVTSVYKARTGITPAVYVCKSANGVREVQKKRKSQAE